MTDRSYLHFHIFIDVWAKVIERDQGEPGDVDAVDLDALHHLLGQIEDGVLVWLHGLGGVDDKSEWRVERFVRPGSGATFVGRLRTESTLTVAETSLVKTTEIISVLGLGVTLTSRIQQWRTDAFLYY